MVYLVSVNGIKVCWIQEQFLLTVSITSSLWMPRLLHFHSLCLHFIPLCCLLLLSVIQQIVFNLDPKIPDNHK